MVDILDSTDTRGIEIVRYANIAAFDTATTSSRPDAADNTIVNIGGKLYLIDSTGAIQTSNHERIIRDNSGDYSINNVTTFQDIDTTNLSISLTTHGGPVWVSLLGKLELQASEVAYFDVAVDGTRVGNAYTLGLFAALTGALGAGVHIPINMSLLLTGLVAATYVLRPQWRTGTGDTVALNSDTTTHPLIFEAIEL